MKKYKFKKAFRFSKGEKRTIIAAKKNGLTYEQIFKKFGVHQPTISRWLAN